MTEKLKSETQHQRWVKYGANVVLNIVLVIVLAGVVIWGAQKYKRRADLTEARVNSLQPQTINIIRNLQSPVKLVSLYPRLKHEPGKEPTQDFYGPVLDVLEAYRAQGKNITVEAIDPVADPVKVDTWLGEITRKYGGDVSGYRKMLTEFPQTLEQIRSMASTEIEQMRQLAEVELADEKQLIVLQAAYNTVAAFPQLFEALDRAARHELEQKMPDYKRGVEDLTDMLRIFSGQVGRVRDELVKLKDAENAPEQVRKYAGESVPRFEQMKKLADDELAKADALGELKFDEIRRKLMVRDNAEAMPPAIAVMGETDIRLIDFDDVWKSGQTTQLMGSQQDQPKLRFAGEQRLTAAILALSQPKKQTVVFVRGGGEPLIGGMFGRAGKFNVIAERLREYNFEVLERDISGQWAQMSAMRQMPAPEEATDEQMRDAIWIVVSEAQQGGMMGMMPPSPELGERLKAHLEAGGSALVLFNLRGDSLSAALDDWGVRVNPNIVAVHEAIPAGPEPPDDFVEQARRIPPIFVLNHYGDHPITQPVNALDSAWVPITPIRKADPLPEGVQYTPIIPLPTEPRSWGESDIFSLQEGRAPRFDSKSGDIEGPLFAGAAVEKSGKGRLVAIGSTDFVSNLLLQVSDEELRRSGIEVARFPANGELFMNAIFWLTKQEDLMALSPTAMDTPRIAAISPATQRFWSVGVMMIGLPALAVFAGLVVWNVRRD